MESLLQSFIINAERHGSFREGDSLLLAVSGGVDSMTMLELFQRLRIDRNLNLSIAHINHQLRGAESDGDEAFVRDEAARRGIPFFSTRVDTLKLVDREGLSKQVAARQLRYAFLESTRNAVGAQWIATAHTANDNAETVLMNSLRGAGIRGLAGIPLRDEQRSLTRPLLFAYRNEVAAFAQQEHIAFREDSSNATNDYRRNYLRHVSIPELEKNFDPSIQSTLNALALNFRSLQSEIDRQVRDIFPSIISESSTGEFSLDIRRLPELPEYLRSELILELFRRISLEPSSVKVHAILELTQKQTGRIIELSKRWNAIADRGRILFHQPHYNRDFSRIVALGETLTTALFEVATSKPFSNVQAEPAQGSDSILVDADKLASQLVIRPWKAGDSFVPIGFHHHKKLSDFFVDRKVPRWQKSTIPLVESEGRIVWVCGLRLDERFIVSPQTTSVVKLSYHNFV